MSYAEKAREYGHAHYPEFEKVSTDQVHMRHIMAFALWLDKEAAQEAMGDKPAPQVASCPQPSSEGDEWVCRHPLCGRRWDKHEDKPPCPRV